MLLAAVGAESAQESLVGELRGRAFLDRLRLALQGAVGQLRSGGGCLHAGGGDDARRSGIEIDTRALAIVERSTSLVVLVHQIRIGEGELLRVDGGAGGRGGVQAVGRERAGEERGPTVLGEAPVGSLRALDPAHAVAQRGLRGAAHLERKRRKRLRKELRGDIGIDVSSELALRKRAGTLHGDLVGRSASDRRHDVLHRAPEVRLELAARSGVARAQERDPRDRRGRDVGVLGARFLPPAAVGALRRHEPRERPVQIRLDTTRLRGPARRLLLPGRSDRFGARCGDERDKEERSAEQVGESHGEPLLGGMGPLPSTREARARSAARRASCTRRGFPGFERRRRWAAGRRFKLLRAPGPRRTRCARRTRYSFR